MNKNRVLLCASFVLLMGLLPLSLLGQESQTKRSLGYFFFAPGIQTSSNESFFHFGGGGEYSFFKGLGFGGEIGYLSSWREAGSGAAVLSLNGVYRFGRGKKLEPFVLGGYTVGFNIGNAVNAFNLGGGVNYWFRDKMGLRLEFRDQIVTTGSAYHFAEFRIGLSFR